MSDYEVDWRWVFDNPKDAADNMGFLLEQVAQHEINEALYRDDIEQLKKDKAELVEALNEAGENIMIAGEFLHEHHTIEKGRKYLAIANTHANED